MSKFKIFTGGAYETNSYLVEAPEGKILFDAPEGADAHYAGEKIGMLVLTHGHWDHTMEAAAVKRRHGCPVVCHAETVPMIADENFFKSLGFPMSIPAVEPDRILGEGKGQDLLGWKFDVFYVPGHCPGSLCFYLPEEGALVGGDVLFCGGVGRWDLPGGDGKLLFDGIREKLFLLPDETIVLPGHGPSTTIGHERTTNPFLQGV